MLNYVFFIGDSKKLNCRSNGIYFTIAMKSLFLSKDLKLDTQASTHFYLHNLHTTKKKKKQ